MAEVQKEFSALSAEMKEIEATEKREANKAKFAEYLFKVGTYGHALDEEEKITDLTDEDREGGHMGMSGLAYTGFEGRSQSFGYVMLKTKEEYKRVKKILTLLDAAQALATEGTKDKEKHLKVLLGEVDG
jgi:hypothetical protein